MILDKFKNFNKLKIIEIGSGIGTNSVLMAKRGADITVLDYSEKALLRSNEFFRRNGLNVEFIYEDALKLPKSLYGQFDISMSFGLAEHFKGKQRLLIVRSHFDVLKNGGIAFISVPNALNIPYRLYKFVTEILGIWPYGEEYPYTRKEFIDICRKLNIEEHFFIGDSIFRSFNFINPLKFFRSSNFKSDINVEKGTYLDEYVGYALVLCAIKKNNIG